MPIEVSIDQNNNLVRRTITGAVSMDEMIASLEDTPRHPHYRPGMNELTDLRDHVHQATSEDIRKLAQFVEEHVDFTRGARTALVVSQPVSYGMARMLQIRIEDLPQEMTIFYDVEEAERWLGVT